MTAVGTTEGQVALITGAGRGIGAAVARHLGREGWTVGVLARTVRQVETVAEDIVAAGGRALALPASVTDAEAVSEHVATLERELGPVALTVNCAGAGRVVGPFWEADLDDWWEEVEGHALGAATVARAVLPAMIERRAGRLVNVYGNLGDRDGRYASAYACGKAVALRLTDHLDAETREHGVLVFALHPGLVLTQMTRHLAEDDEANRWLPRFRDLREDRYASPVQAAEMVVAIGAGRLDHLSGRLVWAGEHVEDLEGAERDGDERALRVVPPS
jgi:NAD(P)-dependent dehydrogenase (short-subunit alcohol dehydrogenase family)